MTAEERAALKEMNDSLHRNLRAKATSFRMKWDRATAAYYRQQMEIFVYRILIPAILARTNDEEEYY